MFHRHICLLFTFFMVVGLSNASAKSEKVLLPPPAWECIQTIGGDVVLNWSVVPDPGGNFVQYEVHSLEDGLITTIANINTTSYTHVGVNSIKNYYIVVIDNVTGPSSSLVIQNLRMTLNNPNNGTAIINWNNTNFPMAGPPARPVDINRNLPTIPWMAIDSVTSNTVLYRDTIDVCQEFIEYQISFPGNGCDFTSNIIGDIFEDKISPDIPVVSNVTIDSLTGLVSINWNQNGQPDTYGYIVYLQNAAGNVVELDTVWGIGSTSFTYMENTSLGSLTYSIAAFDSCFTTSIPATYQTSAKADIHTTTFLQGHFDPCGSMGVLDWTPYTGWPIDHYEVFVNAPTGPWTLVLSTNALQHSEIFTETGFHDVAIGIVGVNGEKSFSNKITLNVSTNPAPSVNYILTASVIGQQIHIRHLVDTSGNVSAIAFERQRKDGSFYEVGRENVIFPVTNFIDEDANVEEVNVYRAIIVDSCGFLTTISDTVYTTVLSIVGDSVNYINTISWTPYIGFDGTIQRYDLFRIVDGQISPSAIASVGPNTFAYDDNVLNEFVRNKLCYYVVAVENTNSYGYAERANSNLDCSEFTPTVFIPNAFTPDGFNPIFIPKYSYMKLPHFQMRIYDRWGEEIYQTEDPLKGWNGHYGDSYQPAPDGAYIYTIRFYGIDDKQMFFKGHVNLLR